VDTEGDMMTRWMFVCLVAVLVAGCVEPPATPRGITPETVERDLELARLRMELSGMRTLTDAAGSAVDLDSEPEPQVEFVEVQYVPEGQSEMVPAPCKCGNPDCQCVDCIGEACRCGDGSGDVQSGGLDAAVPVSGVDRVVEGLVVRWSVDRPVAASAAERLPRIVMLSAEWCGPCRTTKQAAGDLIGPDAAAVVQVVDVEKNPDYAAEYNVMQAASLPSFFVYAGGGARVTQLRVGGSTRAGLEQMARESGVSLQPLPAKVAAGVTTAAVVADPSLAGVLQLLADHVARSQQVEPAVAGLFEITLDVPDTLPSLLSALLLDRVWNSESLGLRLSLPESSGLTMNGRELSLSEPLMVSVDRGPVRITAELHGVTVSADGREVRLDLRGRGLLPVPDLTVVFE